MSTRSFCSHDVPGLSSFSCRTSRKTPRLGKGRNSVLAQRLEPCREFFLRQTKLACCQCKLMRQVRQERHPGPAPAQHRIAWLRGQPVGEPLKLLCPPRHRQREHRLGIEHDVERRGHGRQRPSGDGQLARQVGLRSRPRLPSRVERTRFKSYRGRGGLNGDDGRAGRHSFNARWPPLGAEFHVRRRPRARRGAPRRPADS